MSQALDPIRVTGLRELQASLRALDGNSQKKLRLVLNSAAGIVVRGTQQIVPVVTGRLKGSIKASSSQREASVSEGGSRVPYAPFVEFGGSVGRHAAIKRPFVKQGRYLYPTYYAHKNQIQAELAKGLGDLITESGLTATD